MQAAHAQRWALHALRSGSDGGGAGGGHGALSRLGLPLTFGAAAEATRQHVELQRAGELKQCKCLFWPCLAPILLAKQQCTSMAPGADARVLLQGDR